MAPVRAAMVHPVKHSMIVCCLLALGGCATGEGAAARPSTTPAGSKAEATADARLERLLQATRAGQQRIQELEARVALLEQEARSARQVGRQKPTETVRIGGEGRRTRAAKSRREAAAPPEPRTVIRLHNAPASRGEVEPLALPSPPPGVPTRLPVAPLPTQRAAARKGQPSAGDTPREAYREALGLVRARDYAAALSKLDAFLASYPQHALSDNAVYWRGEVHYARREYERALSEFQGVLSRYPNSNKAADAMLKIGMCHLRLGDDAAAAAQFDRVRKQYPDSDAARIASREGSS